MHCQSCVVTLSIFLMLLQVGKLLLNALLYPGIKMNIQKNTITTIFHTLVIANETEFYNLIVCFYIA